MDERLARKVAKLHGIKPIGTFRVILLAYEKGIVEENKLREIIDKIVHGNFRVGADVISEFWLLFSQLKKKKRR